jgi:hypothetical protein
VATNVSAEFFKPDRTYQAFELFARDKAWEEGSDQVAAHLCTLMRAGGWDERMPL